MQTVPPRSVFPKAFLLTVALMTAIALVLIVGLNLIKDGLNTQLVGRLVTAVAAAAGGGAIAVRFLGIPWRGAGIASLVSPFFWITLPEAFGVIQRGGSPRDMVMSLILTTVLGGAGIFILPLVDPVVRRRGPAPSVRKVARMALFITVVLAGWDFLTLAPSEFSGYFGLKILVVGGVISAAMVGIGLTLILAGLASSASQVGGLGLYLGAVSALVWILAGRPWFP